jgi:pimeloyl-ACP methyl ester carboxylesterase
MQATAVEIHRCESRTLRGQRWGSGERWAVLVHDEGQDLDGWAPLVGELGAAGVSVLALDLAGHGTSDDPWDPAGAPADIVAAMRFAQGEGATAMFLVGAGVGATAALVAAAQLEPEAIVALSPRAALDGVPPDAIRETRAPKLFVVGGADQAALAHTVDVYRRAIGWGLVEQPPVAEQGTDLLASEWSEQVAEKIVGFLRDYF